MFDFDKRNFLNKDKNESIVRKFKMKDEIY